MNIEHNIPIPKKQKGSGKWKTIFNTMKIGDSISIKTKKEANSARVSAYHYHKPIKVLLREMPNKQYRLWRIK